MRQLYIAFLLLLVLTPLGYAQKYEDRAKNFYKYGNYEKALKDYIRLYRRDQENVELLQLIVDCYIFDEEVKDGVMPYLDKLLTLKPEDAKANLSMAKALFHSYKFDQADEWVVKAYNLFSSDAVEEKKECENLRIYIQNAKELVKKPIDITFINVGDRINTSRNEVNPYTVRDESAIFYTSDKRYNSFAGIYYYNVCAAELNGMFFEKGKTIGSYVNSIYDEWVAGITPDGKMLFVHHNRDDEHAMGYAEYKGNYRFDALLPFGDPIDQAGNEYGLWMTESTDTIVFSGDADNGTMDLFYAIRKPDGQFGYARPLPGLVNSDKYNENYPMLTDNGTRLYFCSDNEKSMGGYDIFYSDWDKSANGWGSPVNIGYPLNDTYDNP